MNTLKSKLQAVEAINSVAVDNSCHSWELTLNVSFADAEKARKLHRKLVKTIQRCDGVLISAATTTLTDIY